MAWTIWRYPVVPTPGEFDLDLPYGAAVLSVGVAQGTGSLWVSVNPDNRVLPRRFLLAHTGGPIPDGWAYRGSFVIDPMLPGLSTVGHVFEREGS